ncbi:hypothetical protein GUJ93_ZPchr0007g6210 [Zizania palustris]|uniref:Uncharacterized protein n=1 Tax=Zizania palustris TaxID=103762 RepID=A0A8J5W5Y4_ZIZPA|nr:hypothetical protein GUJ93_ZPchr0007g6210 [Zizania palustris]
MGIPLGPNSSCSFQFALEAARSPIPPPQPQPPTAHASRWKGFGPEPYPPVLQFTDPSCFSQRRAGIWLSKQFVMGARHYGS